MPKLTIDSTATLNDGNRMPLFGLGVFQLRDAAACERAIHAALDCGYRHIDTAFAYGNEAEVGSAIQSASVDRDALFLTTKIMPNRFGQVRETVESSLRSLRVDTIDLYLIHWPVREGTETAYETLVQFREEGKIRSVGVSNFSVRRFEEQFFQTIKDVPAANQIERHPFRAQNDIVEYCKQKQILPEAYSPIVQGRSLDDPTLQAIANDHGKSVPQVMLRWHLQSGVAVIPKSANPDRIRENADIFDFVLDPEAMAKIDSLDRDQSIISWRPEDGWF